MFVINGGCYALTAPFWGWMCDKHADPRTVATVGAGFVAIAFLFIGPAPFLHFSTDLGSIFSKLHFGRKRFG
jgi:hypothetical protein